MDPLALKFITGAVFILVYALIIKWYDQKAWIIAGGVVLLLFAGAVTIGSAWIAINWNVIGIYVGMLFLSQALIESKVADYLAIWVVNRTKRVSFAMLGVCAIAGILSAVLENVACVLIVAPIAFVIAKRLKISPVSMIIGTAVCSNLQGVATLIGDPPSMILAVEANMNFNDFFFFQGKPGLFFAVQLGFIAGLAFLYWVFRKHDHAVQPIKQIQIKSMFPLTMLLALVVSLAFASSANRGISLGFICLFFGFAALVWLLMEHKKNEKIVWREVFAMDWATAVFIVFVFILVDSLTRTGLIFDLANLILGFTGSSLLSAFILIIVFSLILSAFIDNVPYIVAMLGVTQIIAQRIDASPYVLYFALLIATCVGGNITPIGASANIVGVGMLKHRGFKTTFWQFVDIGLPFTIISVAVSCAFIWLMFG
ncbi:MAG: SLC13 family permease [Candidatus Woesearchaeota archaeon]